MSNIHVSEFLRVRQRAEQLQTELDLAKEELRKLAASTEAAAMAATVPAEPVALDHIACIDGGELRFMSGRKAPAYDCELYAMPDGKNAPPLFAQAPVAGQPAEPSQAYWAVIAKSGEGVLFTEHADAQWTLTGRGAGSDGFGVPTIGEAFRDAYDDEQDEFKLVRVQIVPDAAPKGDSNG